MACLYGVTEVVSAVTPSVWSDVVAAAVRGLLAVMVVRLLLTVGQRVSRQAKRTTRLEQIVRSNAAAAAEESRKSSARWQDAAQNLSSMAALLINHNAQLAGAAFKAKDWSGSRLDRLATTRDVAQLMTLQTRMGGQGTLQAFAELAERPAAVDARCILILGRPEDASRVSGLWDRAGGPIVQTLDLDSNGRPVAGLKTHIELSEVDAVVVIATSERRVPDLTSGGPVWGTLRDGAELWFWGDASDVQMVVRAFRAQNRDYLFAEGTDIGTPELALLRKVVRATR